MGTHIWYLMASLLLVTTKAQMYEKLQQSFYERPESSSPSPPPTESPPKEIVLFLTSDQVQTLKSAGAVVRPLSGDETERPKTEPQKQSQQNNEEYIPQYRSSNEDKSYDAEVENYYKLLNIQGINDDLTQEQQTAEVNTGGTERPTLVPRYKYTKSQQQLKGKEYLRPYVPKKSKSKSNQNANSEYVRFLPNYETENVKNSPYQAAPLSPYRFEQKKSNVNTQGRYEVQANDESNDEADENNAYNQAKLYIDAIKKAQSNSADERERTQETVENESESSEEEEEEEGEEASVPGFTQRLVKAQAYIQAQRPGETREGLSSSEQQQEQPQSSAPQQSDVQTLAAGQDKSSALLAPLYQHRRVAEIIAQKKKELINHELDIRSKLQKIKQAAQHDDKEYAAEIAKLTSNLKKQNALAEIEVDSKSPSFVNQEPITTKRRPIEIVKQSAIPSTPLFVRISKPGGSTSYPVAVELARSKQLSEANSDKAEAKKPRQGQEGKRIPVALNRSYYGKVNKPYIVQKAAPLPVKTDIIGNIPYLKPEQLTILRHIWEH